MSQFLLLPLFKPLTSTRQKLFIKFCSIFLSGIICSIVIYNMGAEVDLGVFETFWPQKFHLKNRWIFQIFKVCLLLKSHEINFENIAVWLTFYVKLLRSKSLETSKLYTTDAHLSKVPHFSTFCQRLSTHYHFPVPFQLIITSLYQLLLNIYYSSINCSDAKNFFCITNNLLHSVKILTLSSLLYF